MEEDGRLSRLPERTDRQEKPICFATDGFHSLDFSITIGYSGSLGCLVFVSCPLVQLCTHDRRLKPPNLFII